MSMMLRNGTTVSLVFFPAQVVNRITLLTGAEIMMFPIIWDFFYLVLVWSPGFQLSFRSVNLFPVQMG